MILDKLLISSYIKRNHEIIKKTMKERVFAETERRESAFAES